MAGISAGSDGVNAVGAEPPAPTFSSAGIKRAVDPDRRALLRRRERDRHALRAPAGRAASPSGAEDPALAASTRRTPAGRGVGVEHRPAALAGHGAPVDGAARQRRRGAARRRRSRRARWRPGRARGSRRRRPARCRWGREQRRGPGSSRAPSPRPSAGTSAARPWSVTATTISEPAVEVVVLSRASAAWPPSHGCDVGGEVDRVPAAEDAAQPADRRRAEHREVREAPRHLERLRDRRVGAVERQVDVGQRVGGDHRGRPPGAPPAAAGAVAAAAAEQDGDERDDRGDAQQPMTAAVRRRR